MPLERAASNHTRVESFNYWGSRRFLSGRIKRRTACLEICKGRETRVVDFFGMGISI